MTRSSNWKGKYIYKKDNKNMYVGFFQVPIRYLPILFIVFYIQKNLAYDKMSRSELKIQTC